LQRSLTTAVLPIMIPILECTCPWYTSNEKFPSQKRLARQLLLPLIFVQNVRKLIEDGIPMSSTRKRSASKTRGTVSSWPSIWSEGFIDVLAFKNPRPKGSQKLSARERYRIRQGDYRIVYSILDDHTAVHVCKIGQRREVYLSSSSVLIGVVLHD
jgi:mRNA-degrading endonuclease RelE of RelBE toxin-antitoxin system